MGNHDTRRIAAFAAGFASLTALAGVSYAAQQPPAPAAPAAPTAPASTPPATVTTSSEQVKEQTSTTVTTSTGDKTTTQSATSEYNKSSTTAPAKPAAATASSAVKAPVATSAIIPWSNADRRPAMTQEGDRPALYVWHEKNTVYVSASGGAEGVHVFEGSFDIDGGRFDTLKSVTADAQDRFSIDAQNRVTFRLNTGRKDDTFKFNLRETPNVASKLRMSITLDGQPTDRIFFGSARTQIGASPVTFELRK